MANYCQCTLTVFIFAVWGLIAMMLFIGVFLFYLTVKLSGNFCGFFLIKFASDFLSLHFSLLYFYFLSDYCENRRFERHRRRSVRDDAELLFTT